MCENHQSIDPTKKYHSEINIIQKILPESTQMLKNI